MGVSLERLGGVLVANNQVQGPSCRARWAPQLQTKLYTAVNVDTHGTTLVHWSDNNVDLLSI